MRKVLYSGVALAVLGGIAWAQSVGWPPPAGMMAVLGVYNSTPPTLTNAQVSPLQLDANGDLKVVNSGTPSGTQDINLKQYNGTTVGATNAQYVQQGTGAVWTTQADGAQISTATTAALAANQVIKASSGQLYSFEVAADSTLSAAAWWIMIYNATSAPTDGAVTPAKCYAMPLGTATFSAAFPNPVPFSTGITIGVSTNGCFTKAASTHAFISADYK